MARSNPTKRTPHSPTGLAVNTPPADAPLSRRQWLRGGLAAGVGLPLAAAARPVPFDLPAEAGAPFTGYGQPSTFERELSRPIGLNHRGIDTNGAAWSPIDRLEGTLTPNGLHFVRSHNGTPAIDPARHRLTVFGKVRQALSWDLATLRRYPLRSHLGFLECGGNSNAAWHEQPVQRPVALVHGLVSCAEWTGVPLRLLLEEAGADLTQPWLIATGADPGALHMSLPMDKALDDCLLALYQNGEPLRPENGYPMRLIVPGWKGVLNVKWLQALRVSDQPAMSRNETARYTELQPDGRARQFAFVMEVKSLITRPSHGQALLAPGPHPITGLAWSGRGRITRVEVSTDGGRRWADAELQPPVLPRCLTRFHLPWRWDGGVHVLQSRAHDETGAVQPGRQALFQERGRRSFYHHHAVIQWEVDEIGYVSHVYADPPR